MSQTSSQQPSGQQPGQQDPPIRFWAEMGSNLRDGLFELLVWAIAVVVVVGGFAGLGYLISGGFGAVIGAVVGALALGVLWFVLVLTGASLATRLLRRARPPAT